MFFSSSHIAQTESDFVQVSPLSRLGAAEQFRRGVAASSAQFPQSAHQGGEFPQAAHQGGGQFPPAGEFPPPHQEGG